MNTQTTRKSATQSATALLGTPLAPHEGAELSGRGRTAFRGLLDHMPDPAVSSKATGCSGGCRAKALTGFNKQGMSACQAGRLEEAVDLLKQGVALAQKSKVDMYEAKMRNNLGLVFILMHRLEEAAEQFDRALELVDSRLGRENSLYKRIERQRREHLGSRAEGSASAFMAASTVRAAM